MFLLTGCTNIQDFANPYIRRLLRLYPEKTSGKISEVWQASKWLNELDDKCTPMVVGNNGQHFYVKELAFTNKKEFVIPLKWFTRDNALYGDCWKVTRQVRQLITIKLNIYRLIDTL